MCLAENVKLIIIYIELPFKKIYKLNCILASKVIIKVYNNCLFPFLYIKLPIFERFVTQIKKFFEKKKKPNINFIVNNILMPVL